jgi:predicted DNA-binding transcriptional regulator YafY
MQESTTVPDPSRLARALGRLFDHGARLTKEEAAERLGCTPRHVQRLVEDLRVAGVPVCSRRRGRAHEYFLEPEHQRRRVVLETLDEEALYVLTVAAQASRSVLAGTALEATLDRAFGTLLAAIGDEEVFSFEPDAQAETWHFRPLVSAPVDPEVFLAVKAAVTVGYRIRIDYRNGEGKRTFGRLIDPLALAPLEGTWQLAAYCHARQALRDFNLSRVTNVRALPGQTFVRPDDFDRDTHFAGRFRALAGSERFDVLLRVDADRAVYFETKRYHPSQSLAHRADGSLDVRFSVPNLEDLRPFIASWGPHVQVLAPPELATRIAEDAAATARRYADHPHACSGQDVGSRGAQTGTVRR